MTENRRVIGGKQYLVCTECDKTLEKGYDSPALALPGETQRPVLCGPDYKTAFRATYPTSTVPDVEDGYLE